MEISEIREFRDYMVNTRHSQRVNEQREDQTFVEDTFDVPLIKNPKYLIRLGFVPSMINTVTQQLFGDNPRVFMSPKLNKSGDESSRFKEGTDRAAAEANRWIKSASRQSVNKPKETGKKLMVRGEAWVYVVHKPELLKMKGLWQEEVPFEIPVKFVLYDPMVVFSDPNEEIDGEPERVLVYYKRKVSDIKASYPYWNDNGRKPTEYIDFTFFFDKKISYAEAGDEPLFMESPKKIANGDGRRDNPYTCVPFTHAYSGWGMETEERKPELLAYSRIRPMRGRLVEAATMASDFAYNIHDKAWKTRNLYIPMDVTLPPDWRDSYSDEPHQLNIIRTPNGEKIETSDTQVFSAEVFAYFDRVKADLAADFPSSMRGMAGGSSGRQEDVLTNNAHSIYDCLVENNNLLWARSIDKGMQICSHLNMIPRKMKEGDAESYSEITVDLKKDDPMAESRRSAEGDRKYQLGIIDSEELYMEYMGKTKEEAKALKARLFIDQRIKNSPFLGQIIDEVVAEKLGKTNRLNELRNQGKDTTGMNPTPQFGSQGGSMRLGELSDVSNADLSTRHEARVSPGG
jgi:hypothetical protein